MSRFNTDDYEEMFPGQGELWQANVARAIKGKKGQRDLKTLEAALLSLPEKRLIHGRLAKGNEVCAVGALVLQRRCEQGEDREDVLADLRKAVIVYCADCYHTEEEHKGGRCSACVKNVQRYEEHPSPYRLKPPDVCKAFVDSEESETEDYGEVTAETGKKVGMTSTLAWRIGGLNDVDFEDRSPEERYEAVLNWVRKNIHDESVAA